MPRGRKKKVVVSEEKNVSTEEAAAKGFSGGSDAVAAEAEKTYEERNEERNKKLNSDFKVFDKVNEKIQDQINSMLKKEGIDVEFLDNDTTVSDFIDTGNLALNFAISGRLDGGWPVGRISEIAGDPSTGKTLVSTIAAVKALIKGYMVYYIDSEQAYDVNFAKLIAKTLGQPEDIVLRINYIQIDKVEELTSTVTKIVDVFEKNSVGTGALIIVDSVAFLSTNKEETDVMANKDKVDMTKAKKLRSFIRTIKNKIKHLKMAMIMTNQLTFKIGVTFGDKKTTGGGTAVPFATSVRVRLSGSLLKKAGNAQKVIGLKIWSKTVKTRLTTPHKTAEFCLMFNGRFSKWSGLLEMLLNQEIILPVKVKKGSKVEQDEADEKEKEDNSRGIKVKKGGAYKLGDLEFEGKDFHEKICKDPVNFQKLKDAIAASTRNEVVSTEDEEAEEALEVADESEDSDD